MFRAVERLAARTVPVQEKEEHLARGVEPGFFSGLDVSESTDVLGISESTIERDWALAKARLHRD
jgi:hypothetical protein